MHTTPWLDFKDLEVADLYALLQLRAECFIVEQRSYYQDLDNHDQHASHLLVWDSPRKHNLWGYIRILQMRDDKGSPTGEVSFGRLVVAQQARGSGLARDLIGKAMHEMYARWSPQKPEEPPTLAVIEAQTYLYSLYAEFGFTTRGQEYMLDGLPHVEMVAHLKPGETIAAQASGTSKRRRIPTAAQ